MGSMGLVFDVRRQQLSGSFSDPSFQCFVGFLERVLSLL